jgi:hypothetical protein
MNDKLDLGALIEANRIATTASSTDRERNRRKLAVRIGSGIAFGTTFVAARSAAAGAAGGAPAYGAVAGGLGKFLAATALVVVGGAVGVHSIRHRLEVRPAVAASAPSLPAALPLPQLAPRAEATATEATTAALDDDDKPPTRNVRSAAPAAGVGATTDKSFLRALELLRSARRALDRDSPRTTLALLDRYAAEFPRGSSLQAEYEATRVLALCAAGRVEEAESARTHFLERQSGSPLADRVRAVCARP